MKNNNSLSSNDNIQKLDVYFILSEHQINFYRGNNKPENAHQIVAELMDCDGWSHAWLFDINEIAKGNTPDGWHMQFDGTLDASLSDAIMNMIQYPNATEITKENSGSNVMEAVHKFDKFPFAELPYKYVELPNLVHLAFSEIVSENILFSSGVDFNDLDQAYRYDVPVQSKLILVLPVTDFRPEAMRVTERTAGNDNWFEVETFNSKLDRWTEQKNHPIEADAIADAIGWYPPVISTDQKYGIYNGYAEEFWTEDDFVTPLIFSSVTEAVDHLTSKKAESSVINGKKVTVGDSIDDYEGFIKEIDAFTLERLTAVNVELQRKLYAVNGQRYSGLIIDVQSDYVVQKIGREPDQVVRHKLSKLTHAVEKGDVADIWYTTGMGEVMHKYKGVER